MALVAALSDAGLRRSEASSLTWGDVQRWNDGRPHHRAPLQDRRRSPGRRGGEVKVVRLSESQIVRRVKVIAKAAGLADWEFFSGHSGRVGMVRRMAQNGAPTHEIERQGRWKQGAAWSAATPAASPPARRCGTFNRIRSVAQAPAPNSKAGWAIAARTRESRSGKLPAVIFQVYSRARRGIGTWDDAARIGLWRLHPYGTWDFTLQPTAFRIVPGSKHVQTPWSTSP